MAGTPQGTRTYFGQLTNALAAISANPGNLGTLILGNPNAAAVYLQLFDAPATGGQGVPVLGAATPKLSIMIPASGVLPIVLPEGQQLTFLTAMTAAATTTPTGAAAPVSPIDVNVIFR
jgi:hypothetical protein